VATLGSDAGAPPADAGSWRAHLELARPKLLPFVLALCVLGYAWAHWDRAMVLTGAVDIPWVLAAWTLLHAGTLWLNAALDRDEGEVLFGRAVAVPPNIARTGYLALLLSVPLAAWADPVSGVACALCVALAIAYSHPALAWKGHPLGGPLVNVVGYGLLSPLAGWAVVDQAPNPRTVMVWLLCSVAILGTYLSAQAFQQEEDLRRGQRTLVATHGPRVVLQAARACIGLALLGGMLLAVLGWLPRICLFGIVGWWWVDRHLAAWAREPGGGTAAWARGFAVRMLLCALLGIGLALVQYTSDSLARRPVAGLGTAAGHPPDRPRHRLLPQTRPLPQRAEDPSPSLHNRR
jgi:1,4-dihydroxy-2-naphthoate octaprenyltransferase